MVTEPENGIDEITGDARPPMDSERLRRPSGDSGPPGRGAVGDDDRPKRGGFRRRRVCVMCADHIKVVDYKNASFLRRFVSDRGRIDTRRRTSACAKHQRAISRAIKRARHLALIPYTAEHIRSSGMGRR